MDREKVIKGLEMCIKDIECTGCPYENDCFAPDDNPFGTSMMRDALALLKEQEAKEQISDAIHETAKQFRQTIVRCKDCKYRPELKLHSGRKGNYTAVEFPDGSKCPCQCEDYFYSWYPKDDWFCANGEHA